MNNILLKDLFRYEGENCHYIKVKLKYIFLVPSYTYILKVQHLGLRKHSLMLYTLTLRFVCKDIWEENNAVDSY